MEELKRNVSEYIRLKEDLKTITERKKTLEQNICSVMEEQGVSTLELTDGTKLNYRTRESLTFTKDKKKKPVGAVAAEEE
jgi:hypothetical protein